jgi:hypothetical protein
MTGTLLPHDPSHAYACVVGRFKAQCFRQDGSLRWEEEFNNGVTNLGFNLMLDSTFKNGSATLYPNWYIGLIGTSTSLAAGDVMSSHSGWTEDFTHYDETTRPQWTAGSAASKSITNSSSVNFTMNTDSTVIKGIFVTSDNGGSSRTTGLLWSTGLFGSDQTLFDNDVLKITYTVTLS